MLSWEPILKQKRCTFNFNKVIWHIWLLRKLKQTRVNFMYQILCTSETFFLFSILIPNSKFVIENKEKEINSNHIQASSLLLIFMTQFTHKGRKCFSVYFFGVFLFFHFAHSLGLNKVMLSKTLSSIISYTLAWKHQTNEWCTTVQT